jgi:hypothetical protein
MPKTGKTDRQWEEALKAKLRYSKGATLPADPDCKEYGVEYLRANPIKWIRKEGFLDLLLFSPLSGCCPHCSPMVAPKGNSSTEKASHIGALEST